MTVQPLNSFARVPETVVYDKKHFSVSMQQQVRMKVKIRDDLKAGGTLVKKFEAQLTEEGIKINLIR